ncbi:MAG: retron system putative HNH endonuclease [Chloroflexota bacterium]
MRYIAKKEPPHELRRWSSEQPVNDDGERINCKYDDMPGAVKTVVKQHLLEEQGYLCCYTGIYISDERSHIEHFKPQSRCEGYEDIAYDNLLAAYPGGNQARSLFGAHAKADWYDPDLMISPLIENCDKRFRFNQFGKIAPVHQTDMAARETITRLGLDHDSLTDMRRQAIQTALFRNKQPLTEKALERIIQSYCEPHSHSRHIRPFCFVIQQAAVDLLNRQRKIREKKRYRKKRK